MAATLTAAQRRLRSLRRNQLLARCAFGAGITASVAGNVAAAHTVIGGFIAVWIPAALVLTTEMMLRVKASSRRLSRCRAVATGVLALIAAWVSYWHMVETVRLAGETGLSVYGIPLTVDVLMIVSTVTLIELGDAIATRAAAQATAVKAAVTRRSTKAVADTVVPAPTTIRRRVKPAALVPAQA